MNFNQTIVNFDCEFQIDIFKHNPPTIMLTYKEYERREYNGALYPSNNATSLIEISLKEEASGTTSHELYHLLEYEYTKLKYNNHQGNLISNIYYEQYLDLQNKLENQDKFLEKLKTFDLIDKTNNHHTPITKQDRLNIFNEFLTENISKKELQQYDIHNTKDRFLIIEKIFNQKSPTIKAKTAQILKLYNEVNDYLNEVNHKSFFHLECNFLDERNGKSYYDKYSEKLARLSGLYFDNDYQSKPLPRGKEKSIYQQKFEEITILLRDEIKDLQNLKTQTNNPNAGSIILQFNKDLSKSKLNNIRDNDSNNTIKVKKSL